MGCSGAVNIKGVTIIAGSILTPSSNATHSHWVVYCCNCQAWCGCECLSFGESWHMQACSTSFAAGHL